MSVVWRARQELAASQDFRSDVTRQDAAILNVERASDAAIDIANRIIRMRGLGAPDSARDSFLKLEEAAIVNADLGLRLRRMVGFRNIAVHQYDKLDLAIVEAVIKDRLDDLLTFSALALRLT